MGIAAKSADDTDDEDEEEEARRVRRVCMRVHRFGGRARGVVRGGWFGRPKDETQENEKRW